MISGQRIIANVVVLNGLAVQSYNFKDYRPLGVPEILVEHLDRWGADEIILTDISTAKGFADGPNFDLIKRISERCFTPLTVSGGISQKEHVEKLLHCGADKIALNSCRHDIEFVRSLSEIYGSQFLVASIDVKKVGSTYSICTDGGRQEDKIEFATCLQNLEALGFGEVLINSIDRDGSKKGFDLELIKMVCRMTSLPVIAIGGAGHCTDFFDVLTKTNIDAVAAGNFFSHFEHSVTVLKAKLAERGVAVRDDNFFHYQGQRINQEGRPSKIEESQLEEMVYLPPQRLII